MRKEYPLWNEYAVPRYFVYWLSSRQRPPLVGKMRRRSTNNIKVWAFTNTPHSIGKIVWRWLIWQNVGVVVGPRQFSTATPSMPAWIQHARLCSVSLPLPAPWAFPRQPQWANRGGSARRCRGLSAGYVDGHYSETSVILIITIFFCPVDTWLLHQPFSEPKGAGTVEYRRLQVHDSRQCQSMKRTKHPGSSPHHLSCKSAKQNRCVEASS